MQQYKTGVMQALSTLHLATGWDLPRPLKLSTLKKYVRSQGAESEVKAFYQMTEIIELCYLPCACSPAWNVQVEEKDKSEEEVSCIPAAKTSLSCTF